VCRRVDGSWTGGGGDGNDVNECLREVGVETVCSSYVKEDASEFAGDNSMVGRTWKRGRARTHVEGQQDETVESARINTVGQFGTEEAKHMERMTNLRNNGAGFSNSY
jgi:hypothetical protein